MDASSLSDEADKKMRCPICYREQEDLYLYCKHLMLYHSHEELARFLAFGEKYKDKVSVDDDQTE